MKTKQSEHQRFCDAVNQFCMEQGDHKFNVQKDYSGRGMFGRTCLSVTCNDIQAIADMYFYLGTMASLDGDAGMPWPKTPYLATDSMGVRLWTVYWPSIECDEASENE